MLENTLKNTYLTSTLIQKVIKSHILRSSNNLHYKASYILLFQLGHILSKSCRPRYKHLLH